MRAVKTIKSAEYIGQQLNYTSLKAGQHLVGQLVIRHNFYQDNQQAGRIKT